MPHARVTNKSVRANGLAANLRINLNDSMPYFGLYVQLRRESVAGYTTDESWAYRPKEGVEAFESITFFY